MNDIRAFSPEWQAQSKIAEWQKMAKEKKLPLNAIEAEIAI